MKRYLRARKGDVKAACAQLTESVAWRATMDADAIAGLAPDVVLLSNASMAPPAGVVTVPLPPDDEDILRFRSIYKPWGFKENLERENFERFFYLRAYMRREVRPPLAPLRICS